ncbi:MAG: hypothetical protein NNA22_11055 [Nitrospira sp.]|nr:hypothetical protein [Nitrospira sp.]
MNLIEPGKGKGIHGVEVPEEVYWVLDLPTPLAGMKYPCPSFPWPNLKQAGFSKVVSLHPGSYDPAPLELCFSEALEDLACGNPPGDSSAERAKIQRAVTATVSAWRSGHGVVVQCVGGRGRTGTVLGCVLRELGFQADEIIGFLDRVHKARGKDGWPESRWQRELVEQWKANVQP